MELCNRIYYSKAYWRLNMFRAAYRSSSRALNCICSLWFIYPCGDRPLSRLSGIFPGCKYSLELLMMSGMPLETCWAFNKLWSNKSYYNAASCSTESSTMHGSMSTKWSVKLCGHFPTCFLHRRLPTFLVPPLDNSVFLLSSFRL